MEFQGKVGSFWGNEGISVHLELGLASVLLELEFNPVLFLAEQSHV